MKKQIRAFALWQSTKTLAAWYFVIAAIAYIILTVVDLVHGAGAKAFMNLIAPIVGTIIMLIIYPLILWIYNLVAGWTGGIEFRLEDPKEDR